jgi:hypothetical protein
MAATFDHRATPELLSTLKPGCFAYSLVRYARLGRWPLDLQFRGYGCQGDHWVTLYMGLTKVLDMFHNKKGFWLSADKAHANKTNGWSESWRTRRHVDELAADWPQVESYLHMVIPKVASRFVKKEGAVQASVSGFENRDFVVLDRECVVKFSTDPERKKVQQGLAKPVLDALADSGGHRWWTGKPKSLGPECDALAISSEGDLLTIELKAASDTAKIAWSPAQARHYARLFQHWAQQDPHAADVLEGMLDQRIELGLAGSLRPRLRRPVRVRPVIGIGHGFNAVALERLKIVTSRLAAHGLDDPAVAVFDVDMTGAFTPIPLA